MLVSEGNVDDSVVGEGGHGVQGSNLLSTALGAGRDKETGVLSGESTLTPEATSGVDEGLPLAGEVSVTSGDTEEEGIVVLQFRGGNNGVVRLGDSVHLSKNLLRKSLRNPEERKDCKY